MEDAKFVDAGGIHTRYFARGSGDSMVLLHGSAFGELSNAEGWEPVLDPFAREFRVHAVDKVGQGFTDNPKSDDEYVIGTTVTHLRDFVSALQLNGIHVVGHSRGAYTACRFALEFPDF